MACTVSATEALTLTSGQAFANDTAYVLKGAAGQSAEDMYSAKLLNGETQLTEAAWQYESSPVNWEDIPAADRNLQVYADSTSGSTLTFSEHTTIQSLRLEEGMLTFKSENGATLQTDRLIAAKDSSLSIESLSGENHTALSGSGEITISNITLGKDTDIQQVYTADDWTGRLVLKNCEAKGTSFGAYGNADSTLVLNGVSGWFAAGESHQISQSFELESEGLTVVENSSWAIHWSGDISGSGNFNFRSKSTDIANLYFEGNLEHWDGAIRVQPHETAEALPDVNLELTAGGMLFSGKEGSGIMMERLGTVNVSMGNTSSATTFRGAILNKGVTVNGATSYGTLNLSLVSGSTTTFEKEVDVTQLSTESAASATFNGEVTVAQDLILGQQKPSALINR